MTRGHQALKPLFNFLETHPDVNLTASDFGRSELAFRKWGISLDSIAEYLNEAATYDRQPNGTGTLHRAELQLEAQLLNDMLWVSLRTHPVYLSSHRLAIQTLGAQPEVDSPLRLKLYIFTNANWDNVTELTDTKFWDILESVIRDRGSSGLWFYPATVRDPPAILFPCFTSSIAW